DVRAGRAVGDGRRRRSVSAQADIHREYSLTHVEIGDASAQERIPNVSALLFGKEEERVPQSLDAVVTFAKHRNVNRTAYGAAEIVIAKRCALRVAVWFTSKRWSGGAVRNKIVGVQSFVAHELKERTVKLVATAAGDNVNLAATAAT